MVVIVYKNPLFYYDEMPYLQIYRNKFKYHFEKGKANMFVTVSSSLAKVGEEDAMIALLEDWERNQQPKATGYLSGELLRNIRNSREFIAIMRFESQEFAQSLANDPEHKAWYMRLTNLAEGIPTLSECTSEWHSQAGNLTNG